VCQGASGNAGGVAGDVFVLHDTQAETIVGYYMLGALQFDPAGLPDHPARKLPQKLVPATLLGRLANDACYRGQGFAEPLLDALPRAHRGSAQIASMAVIVDAMDGHARSFSNRYGFQRFATNEQRLFLPMATIANTPGLAASW
jgi:hypothetical protein